jgi:uncharacterized protein
MKKEFDPRRLDVRRFAQEAGELASSRPLADYPRLAEEARHRGADTPVRWKAHGELLNPQHVQPQVWLHLEGGTTLALTCQRCLNPVNVEVSVKRSFRFVPDEATAAAEDDEAEEDVLAESRSFDLLELVEDELLMDMPLAPRHVICPVVLPTSAGEAEAAAAEAQRPNPFEVLQQLKKR